MNCGDKYIRLHYLHVEEDAGGRSARAVALWPRHIIMDFY
jgi:hypothetical protein